MSLLPSTLGSLIRRLVPSVRRTTGKIVQIDADTVRAIVVLSQMNLHIWHNESNYRKGI